MRKVFAITVLVITTGLVYLFDRPLGPLPALGKLLDPVNGFWANAENTGKDFSLTLNLSELKEPVDILLDERLVPHIKAKNNHDIYFAQGYLHAYFRLWQMDMQTRAAAGRVSEVIGAKGFKFDRGQRRKGMTYAAENSLRAMEADPRSKEMLDAYTAGINSFIGTLNFGTFPLEYKLMGFEPESWTNLKSALLLKYMADDLTGETDDIPLTLMRTAYNEEEWIGLFPEVKGITPVIPAGTAFNSPSLQQPSRPADSNVCVKLEIDDFDVEEETGKGSNNWVLSGSRTKSGKAILCNDPHLGLNLPSLWFEVQLQCPGMNVYGASLPGAPGVIIGFNDKISWGFTNNYRDVKDFYAIKSSADNATYLFNGKQVAFEKRIEKVSVKNEADFIDTVRYTIHGPVMYDEDFEGPGGLKKPLAMCWMAHKPTNELLSVYLLNRSKNYDEFVTAIQQFQCPAQNIAYADIDGNIALWGQGLFVNKWEGQGVFIMNGVDSSTLWKELIPMDENPHAFNPEQGYLSSANQTVTDSTYPYWYNGTFHHFRAWRINEVLDTMYHASVDDMFALQNDNYSILAEKVLPVLIKYVKQHSLTANEQEYLQVLEVWNYDLSANSKAGTVFQLFWEMLRNEFGIDKEPYNVQNDVLTKSERVLAGILREEGNFINSVAPWWEYLPGTVYHSFKKAVDTLGKLDNIEWYHVKNTSVRHLTKIPAFGYYDLEIGGWGNTVNAAKSTHGPSWRMVVEMKNDINAYGVYPGGQSGNPGSKYYASFLDSWVKGEYYKILFLSENNTAGNKKIKYIIQMKPS